MFSFSCAVPKGYVDFRLVKEGKLLFKAKEIEMTEFLPTWLENTYPIKVDFNLNELYKDSAFTYFGKSTFKEHSFYKVKNTELAALEYASINGDTLRKRFINEVIPQADKNKVLKK